MSQHLWHPFADMSRVPGREVVLVRGDGCWVWDAEGSGYLDATAGLWYCNVGHGRAEIAEAGAAQMRTLAGYQTFDVMANRPALDLAERVCALSPLDGPAAAFFTSGGSDSIDTAAKIVRRFWRLHGRPERTTIVARGGAYHGTNAFGTSLAGIEGNAAGWGPLIREVVLVLGIESCWV
jgi:adenosylmethionine-8-amino-7-oxononanoate aminotransferase